jgi:cyanophycinase
MRRPVAVLLLALSGLVAACAGQAPAAAAPSASAAPSTRVGPPAGALVVAGGGALDTALLGRFIALAGGPDAPIVVIPTAGEDSTYPADWRGLNGLRAAGARNLRVLHTTDRAEADTERFASVVRAARGVWFPGGRQWRLVDAYANTRTEHALHELLARGGVVGGTSAGASILASYMLRGARSGNTIIMAPGYETGFGFLRGVAIDQHVVARERLRDLADSLMPRRPDLLGISEDEGTAWVVRGDTAEVIGRGKAFVYGGSDPNDAGVPFLTLRAGDVYDLGARRVTRRAGDGSGVTAAFVDSLVRGLGSGRRATVLVARDGMVLLDRAYGVPPHPRYTPPTTVPNFPLGGISSAVNALAAQLVARDGRLSLDEPLAPGAGTVRGALTSGPRGGRALAELLAARSGTPYRQLVARRVLAPVGAGRTVAGDDGEIASNVDELHRLVLGLGSPRTFLRDTSGAAGDAPGLDPALGWRADTYRGLARLAAYGTDVGGRAAFVRFPARRASVIVLTDDDGVDARALAERLADRLLFAR